MYRTSYSSIPNNTTIYRSNNTTTNSGGYYDERGFWIPFVVGGLAGGALGYGVANNNFLSNGSYPPRPCCGPIPMYYPMPYGPYPYY